jgi:hypothetical protein
MAEGSNNVPGISTFKETGFLYEEAGFGFCATAISASRLACNAHCGLYEMSESVGVMGQVVACAELARAVYHAAKRYRWR